MRPPAAASPSPAWLGPVIDWLERVPPGGETAPVQVLWVTPLRALAADTEANLRLPLEALDVAWTV